MQKLAKNTADMYAMNDGKAGCVDPIVSLILPVLTWQSPYMQLFRQRMANNHENS